jgi:proteasome accessory factor B
MKASVDRHKATITYHSFSSRRIKDYAVEPYRLAYGNGGFYLFAFVPEYGQLRTFAVERIRKLLVSEETFDSSPRVRDGEAFAHSLGVHSGKPERVVIEFDARAAPYIEERTWHPSQTIEAQPGGAIRLSLNVCLDWTLSSWILGFGPLARVVSPKTLAAQIFEELEEARDVYAPRLTLTPMAGRKGTPAGQRGLPFVVRQAHHER